MPDLSENLDDEEDNDTDPYGEAQSRHRCRHWVCPLCGMKRTRERRADCRRMTQSDVCAVSVASVQRRDFGRCRVWLTRSSAPRFAIS
jgi:predicted RNA-binding Zn-ribbon protein involved in translation (DUF1610 family)